MAAPLADLVEAVPLQNAQSSWPEKTRSLPNRDLKPRYEHLVVQAALDFRRIR